VTLCVSSYQLGASFIDKHISGIRPDDTVAIVRYNGTPFGTRFDPGFPVLSLEQWASTLGSRIGRRIGMPQERLRDSAIRKFLQRHGATAVLGDFLDQFLDVVPAVRALGLPYVVQGHGIDVSAALRNPQTAAGYKVYESAAAILTRCEFHRRRLIGLGLPADKIHVNPGGVEVPASKPAKDAASAKRLLAVGMMVPQKAPIVLLESFRRAAARDPDLTLDYVGSGQLLPAAEQFVAACDLKSRVKLHGFAPEAEKRRLLRECGIFVQHSMTVARTGHEEGLPAAIQEAMAHGLAVVSTRHSGIPEAVVHGETGLLVREGDAEAMAQAMVAATHEAERMGAAGYARAKSMYAWEHERDRLSRWLFG